MRKQTRFGLLGISVVLVSVAAWAMFRATQSGAAVTTQGPVAADVPTIVVRRGMFTDHLLVHGYVGAPSGSVARLTFAQAGVLKQIQVQIGERVVAGQALAQLDLAPFNASVSQAEADVASTDTMAAVQAKRSLAERQLSADISNPAASSSNRIASESTLRQAKLRVASDKREVRRQQMLFDAGVAAEKDAQAARTQLASDQAAELAAQAARSSATVEQRMNLRTARTNVVVAQNDVGTAGAQHASAEARLATARISFANGTLRAPADGIVTAIDKHVGETVDTTNPVIEMGSGNATTVTLKIPSDQAHRVHVGDVVSVALGNERQPPRQGRITRLAPALAADSQTVIAVADIIIPNAISGDLLNASIVTAQTRGIVIPTSSIVEDPQSGKTVVFTRVAQPKPDEAPFAEHTITVLVGDDKTSLVSGDVHVGDTIASSGAYTLLAPNGG